MDKNFVFLIEQNPRDWLLSEICVVVVGRCGSVTNAERGTESARPISAAGEERVREGHHPGQQTAHQPRAEDHGGPAGGAGGLVCLLGARARLAVQRLAL